MSVEALETYHRLLAEGKLEEAAEQYVVANAAFDKCFSTIKFLCRKFGTSYWAKDRDEKIAAGVQRMLDEEQGLLAELAALKEKLDQSTPDRVY